MNYLENGEVKTFHTWVINPQDRNVFVIGNGQDLVIRGFEQLQALIDGLQACRKAVSLAEAWEKRDE